MLIVAGVVADYYYLGSLVHHQNVNDLQTSKSTENILLIGSTTRCGLKVQNVAYGLCSQGVTGVNSDIDMILHLDPSTEAVSLLSIPRDLFVPNARTIGANKIDAALYEGPSQLVAAIEEDFAIPINHYVELNFDTFANVVNALGGVGDVLSRADLRQGVRAQHRKEGLLSAERRAGTRGRAREALADPAQPVESRAVDVAQEGLSDLARIRRTHEFLRVLAAKVSARGIGDPITDQSIATSVLPDLTVDNGFSEGAMVGLAKNFAHTSIANVLQLTFPILTVETGSYLYQGYYYGDVEFPVQPSGVQTIDQVLGISSSTNAFTGTALPSPSSFTVSIENATGIANQAAVVARELGRRGFRVRSTGDMTTVGKVGETVVWYGGPRPPANGNWTSPGLAAAQAVLAMLQGPAILGYNPSMVTPGSTVTIQTGTDLTVRTASASASTTAKAGKHKKPTGVTTTTVFDPPGVKTNSSFSAPSLVNQALEPYRPEGVQRRGHRPRHDGRPQVRS